MMASLGYAVPKWLISLTTLSFDIFKWNKNQGKGLALWIQYLLVMTYAINKCLDSYMSK